VIHAVESACAAEGLRLTLKGTLKQYPGCTHWHYQRGKDRGTLEITFWPAQNRALRKRFSPRSPWLMPHHYAASHPRKRVSSFHRSGFPLSRE
jgi:hypothetical protein